MKPLPSQPAKKEMIKMPESNSDVAFYWIAGIIVAFFLMILVAGLVSFFRNFSRELKYINLEIQRTDGTERRYWIRKRRRLWLSLIPFVKY